MGGVGRRKRFSDMSIFSILLSMNISCVQGLSRMQDGTVWAASDDAVLALGLLKWGRDPTSIATDLLPCFSVGQVAHRIQERTHRQRPANVVKVAA